MRLFIHVGPDTLTATRFKTKAACRRALNAALRTTPRTRGRFKKVMGNSDVAYTFARREYSRREIQEATIVNLKEYVSGHFQA